MMIRSNKNDIKEVRVKIASGFLWKIILGIFYLCGWQGGYREVAMIDPFRLEVLSIGDEWIPFSMYCHEMRHIEQVKENGRIKFCIKYIYYNVRYGYKNNPFEIEAHAAEED